jgi:hypothetical protein
MGTDAERKLAAVEGTMRQIARGAAQDRASARRHRNAGRTTLAFELERMADRSAAHATWLADDLEIDDASAPREVVEYRAANAERVARRDAVAPPQTKPGAIICGASCYPPGHPGGDAKCGLANLHPGPCQPASRAA